MKTHRWLLACWVAGFHSCLLAVEDSLTTSTLDTSIIIHQQVSTGMEHTYLTAGDAVRLSPGVFLRTSTAGGIQLVSAQGLNPQHVQVLWNGIPVNSGMLGVSDLSLFTIGYRQEVVYSSNRSDLATGGFAGVVDVKAQPFSDKGILLQLRQSIGSFGQKAFAFTHTGSKGSRHLWGVDFNADRAENDFPYVDYTILPKMEKRQVHAAFRRFAVSPRWQWRNENGHRLTWLSETVFNERHIPPTLVSPTFRALQRDRTTRQQFKWQQFGNQFYQELSGNYIFNYWFYEDIILSRKEENREHLGYLRYSGYFEPSEKWLLSYGTDVKYTSVSTPNYREGIEEWGADIHLKTSWRPLSWVKASILSKVSARSRLPFYFPAVAEISFYPLRQHDVRLWLRSSTDARYPTLNDRFWQPGGNPELQAEQSLGGAGGMQAAIPIGKSFRWNHGVEVFINRVDDMILWMPTNKLYWVPQNIGTVRAFGGLYEQQISYLGSDHQLHVQFSYAYNQSGSVKALTPNDKTVGRQLPYFPLHSLKGNASWRWKGLLLMTDFQAYSRRFVTRDEGQNVPAYALLNTTIGYRHDIQNFDLEGRFTINNLTDQYYEEVVYRPMPGRNYLFTLIINWNHEKQQRTAH